MNVKPSEISIIIVTWNGKQFARECLDSLRTYRDDPKVEIIVVDNASSDGTPALVEQEFPWVCLIRNSANLGFSRANNIGMVATTGKYVCLINSDVRVPHDCLPSMHAYMEAQSFGRHAWPADALSEWADREILYAVSHSMEGPLRCVRASSHLPELGTSQRDNDVRIR
jgi:glycosyltransferase involved in cell wall biosynthesis